MNDWNLEAPWVGREPEEAKEQPKEIPIVKLNKNTAWDLAEKICDEYCKWPSEYKDPDQLWNEKCDHCPFTEFFEKVAKWLKQA